MKSQRIIYVLLIVLLAVGCTKDDPKFQEYTLATPVTISIADLRAQVAVEAARDISESGKLYVYGDYIFVNDINEGIHVIDNSNPATPTKLKFLRIPGNRDISVKGNVLYADSYMDLVYFDITDVTTISQLGRLENVLPVNFNWPVADDYATQDIDYSSEVIIDWTLTTEIREIPSYNEDILVFNSGNQSAVDTGIGGSLARFKIVNDFLYAVDSDNLNVFNISNLSNPISIGSNYVGWRIETIFSDGNYLYIGSNAGMFIYDIVDPASPQFVSEVSHIMGCDPVVVQDDFAYVTIRGGNNCQQEISQLDVIDISNKATPFIVTSVEMEEPYGLGVRGNELYVSDGRSGLKLFNIENPETLFLESLFPEIFVFDVIPLEDKLVVVGDSQLKQYIYTGGDLHLISTLNL
mgnify:CR=1 FL=1|tara:strand:+ start:25035 stop:26258 length:1224 start_codon:yes stop_codon:yes gene_type:complete